jgi:hypothetical protein
MYEMLTNTKSKRAKRLNRKLYLPSFGNFSSVGLLLFLLVEVKSIISTIKLDTNNPKTQIKSINANIIKRNTIKSYLNLFQLVIDN